MNEYLKAKAIIFCKEIFILIQILAFLSLTSCVSKRITIKNPAQDTHYELSDCKNPIKVKTKDGKKLEFREGFTQLNRFIGTDQEGLKDSIEFSNISKISCSSEKKSQPSTISKRAKSGLTVLGIMAGIVGLVMGIVLIGVFATADMGDE